MTQDFVIKKYPNHMIENGILYRGTTTKRVVKPVNGIYKIQYKNEVFYETLEQLKRPTEKEEYVEKNVIDKNFDKNKVSSIIIDLHMKGFKTDEITKKIKKSISFVNGIKKNFVGVKKFETMCTNFSTTKLVLQKKYDLDDGFEKQLDEEDKLRLLSKYLSETKRFNKKTKEDLCNDMGINYRSMYGCLKHRGYNPKGMSLEECIKIYKGGN
jgi:transposase